MFSSTMISLILVSIISSHSSSFNGRAGRRRQVSSTGIYSCINKLDFGQNIETNSFAFEVIVILSFESTHLYGLVLKTGIIGPMTNSVRVKKVFLGSKH